MKQHYHAFPFRTRTTGYEVDIETYTIESATICWIVRRSIIFFSTTVDVRATYGARGGGHLRCNVEENGRMWNVLDTEEYLQVVITSIENLFSLL